MEEIDLSKFENLSLAELRQMATEVGIKFMIGNDNITDKEKFLNVLDEAVPEELEESYIRIIKNRNNNKLRK